MDVWVDSCSVKVAHFDDDHKQMFSIIDSLDNAMRRGKGALVVQQIITELVNHAKHHFSAEEEAMEKTKYPELASHQLEHQELLVQLEQLRHEIADGKFVSSVTVADFLDKCLVPHTKTTDQKYSAHLNANGIF
jgi:hemerythrin